jgi:hypothetical protein
MLLKMLDMCLPAAARSHSPALARDARLPRHPAASQPRVNRAPRASSDWCCVGRPQCCLATCSALDQHRRARAGRRSSRQCAQLEIQTEQEGGVAGAARGLQPPRRSSAPSFELQGPEAPPQPLSIQHQSLLMPHRSRGSEIAHTARSPTQNEHSSCAFNKCDTGRRRDDQETPPLRPSLEALCTWLGLLRRSEISDRRSERCGAGRVQELGRRMGQPLSPHTPPHSNLHKLVSSDVAATRTHAHSHPATMTSTAVPQTAQFAAARAILTDPSRGAKLRACHAHTPSCQG